MKSYRRADLYQLCRRFELCSIIVCTCPYFVKILCGRRDGRQEIRTYSRVAWLQVGLQTDPPDEQVSFLQNLFCMTINHLKETHSS